MALNDAIFLTNDAKGYEYQDRFVNFTLGTSQTSAHGASTIMTETFMVPNGYSGEIVGVGLGVALPAVSASGFVSGTVDATVRINSVAVCSTNPAITMAGSAGQAARTTTFGVGTTALATSAVVNAASNAIAAGDLIAVDINARSVGSAAAGAAGVGVYGYIHFRFKSR